MILGIRFRLLFKCFQFVVLHNNARGRVELWQIWSLSHKTRQRNAAMQSISPDRVKLYRRQS